MFLFVQLTDRIHKEPDPINNDTNYLNTPRRIADQAGNAVWRNDNTEPFADSVPDENPSGLGVFKFPLIFPGTYADRETNTVYSIRRDYDPSIGRYVQSDPVGLGAGLNTYAPEVNDWVTRVEYFLNGTPTEDAVADD
jgi:RHS repeat-associated protein